MAILSQPITGFVLAGGKSSRMRQDKAFLQLAGRPLIANAVELARAVCDTVKIVGEPARFGKWGEVVPDVYAGRGPLGGIHAALMSSNTNLNLILGVDLPFLERRFLSYTISAARSTDAVVTVPTAGGHLQTLCAIYHKAFTPVAERALRQGRNKIDALFREISVRILYEQEIEEAGFPASMFRNLNTPEEWESAKREFESRRLHL
jgi:molybdenum cofactor guanylyltransferase